MSETYHEWLRWPQQQHHNWRSSDFGKSRILDLKRTGSRFASAGTKRGLLVAALAAVALSVVACKSEPETGRPGAPAVKPEPPATKPSPNPALPARASETQAGSDKTASNSERDCVQLPFASSVDLGEASGTVHIDGLGLVVVSDSGNLGAYRILDVKTGGEIERGALDRGGASDDFEGVAFRQGTLYVLSSNGLMSEFRRDSKTKGFVRTLPPYRIGPLVQGCGDHRSNCGPNYEGLCLGKAASKSLQNCDGVAVSKKTGTLICLVISTNGRIAINGDKVVDVAMRETASGCAIDERGSVWVATNIIGANALIEVRADEQRVYSTWALGSLEAIEHIGDETVVFSDTQRSPSSAFRYRCAARER